MYVQDPTYTHTNWWNKHRFVVDGANRRLAAIQMSSEGYFYVVDPGLMFEELEYIALNSNDGTKCM